MQAEIFPWNKNLETGLQHIDEQHKRLVHLLNRLACRFGHQNITTTMDTVLNELTDYASYHFQTEEKIWEKYFQDDKWEVDHAREHINFVATLSKLKAEMSAKPVDTVVEEVLSFMTHWLALHILENDKRMALAVVAMRSGMSLKKAKEHASKAMHGAIKVLIDTILTMYDTLSTSTLQMMKEIIERQKVEEKLRLAANAFDNTLESICITDIYFSVIDANPAFYNANQFTHEEVAGRHLKTLKSGLNNEKMFSEIAQELCAKGHWRGEISNRAKSGELESEWLTVSAVKNEQGAIINHVWVFSSITHLINLQHQLEYIAHHDTLTGLPNRLLLSDRLELAIAHSERNNDSLAVCYLDLDGFKPVNDRLGHAAGDEVLRVIAHRLKKVVRGNDTVARLGGDEFVILLGNQKNTNSYMELLDRLLREVALPIQTQNDSASVTASIGVSFFPKDGADPETLLQYSDEAMYQAKRSGRSKYSIYSPVAQTSK